MRGWLWPGVYTLLGLASSLALLRLVLRLLVADTSNLVGSLLIGLGGPVVAPFDIFFKPGLGYQLPGSVLDRAALLASGTYLGLAVLTAVAVASYRVWFSRFFAFQQVK